MSLPDSPTARALRVLDLLQRHPGITSTEIGRHLSVTDRAARRYVAILREADIAVDSLPGRHGGYRLGRGLRPPPLVFTSAEAVALVLAALAGGSAVAQDGLRVETVLDKIVRVLPPDVRRSVGLVQEHARAVPDRRAAAPDPVVTIELVRAVAEVRRVLVTYHPSSGSAPGERLVDPWAVVLRHGRWYLLCFSHTAGEVRTYRVDRVTAVDVLADRFVPPAGLDPVSCLESHLGRGRQYVARVRFAIGLDQVAAWVTPPMGDLVPLGPDNCLLEGTTSNPRMYASEWLTAVPYPFTVEGGPELRDAVTVLAQRLTRSVGASADPSPSPTAAHSAPEHAGDGESDRDRDSDSDRCSARSDSQPPRTTRQPPCAG